MTRSNKTLRMEDDVDQWVDKFSEENDVSRSDIVNRAIKVYAAKMAKGEWEDPRYRDGIDEAMEKLS